MSRAIEKPPLAELESALADLRMFVSDPFAVFVAEACRGLGFQITEPAQREEARPALQRALQAYERAVLGASPFRDLLGSVYMETSSRSKASATGQFFTPWELSRLAAAMTLADWRPEPRADGRLWTLQEPACGSGGMLLATFAYLVEEFGPAALHLWYVVAVDKDLTLARTCALQVYANLAAHCWGIGEMIVLWGDSLRVEIHGTVAHSRLRPEIAQVARVLAAVDDIEHAVEPGTQPPAAAPSDVPALLSSRVAQGDLFG